MFTSVFWKDTAERAIRTFAQTLLAVIGVGLLDVLHFDWATALSVSLGAAVVSVLMSLLLPAAGVRDE